MRHRKASDREVSGQRSGMPGAAAGRPPAGPGPHDPANRALGNFVFGLCVGMLACATLLLLVVCAIALWFMARSWQLEAAAGGAVELADLQILLLVIIGGSLFMWLPIAIAFAAIAVIVRNQITLYSAAGETGSDRSPPPDLAAADFPAPDLPAPGSPGARAAPRSSAALWGEADEAVPGRRDDGRRLRRARPARH